MCWPSKALRRIFCAFLPLPPFLGWMWARCAASLYDNYTSRTGGDKHLLFLHCGSWNSWLFWNLHKSSLVACQAASPLKEVQGEASAVSFMNKDVLLQSLDKASPERRHVILLQTVTCRRRKTSSTLTISFFELFSRGGSADPSVGRTFSVHQKRLRLPQKGEKFIATSSLISCRNCLLV